MTTTTFGTTAGSAAGMRAKGVAVLAAGLLMVGVLVAAPAGPAVAQAGCDNQVNPKTCDAGTGHPGLVVDLSDEVGPHVSGGGGVKRCLSGRFGTWVDYGPPFPEDFDPGPAPEEGARYWVFVCPNHINGIDNPVNWEGAGWGLTPPEPSPTAADLLPPLWAAVQARLHEPQVSLDPAESERSILNLPTFVEILNPQVATRYTATATNPAGGVTVGIDVIPTTTLHPGEPGADPVACDDDGTAFDPNGPSPEAQAEAAGGACTYTYTRRSATGWPGDVTITWNVTWFSDTGQGGALDAAPSVQGFARIVDELVTVIVDMDGT